jgi:SAM-dependent methyltransferase
MAKFMNFKQSMHDRINRRMDQLQRVADKLHRRVDAGQIGGEEGRIWLEQFAVGRGFQIAGGDFIIGDSINIDPEYKYIGPDILAYWGEVPLSSDPVDYVITNYFECFPSPLRVLTEWYSQLKPGGIVAMVLRNSDAYYNENPLSNKKRVSCFTVNTIKFYLERVGFTVERLETWDKEIRVVAKKP